MTTQTHADQPTTEVVIDTTLMRAAQKAANAQLDPLPAQAHQLHIRKQGSGRPYIVPKKPRHEAVPCKRCEAVTVLVNRLPIFPAEATLPCGHRVTLSAGPALVLDAALLRAESMRRACMAVRRTLLGLRPGETFFTEHALYLNPQEAPGWRPPTPRTPSAEPENIFLRGRNYLPTPPANRPTAPDNAQKPQAALPAAISPLPVSGDEETQPPLQDAQARPAV